jgi:Raf kinase inhibitor-like YbhB/YbcL family protein
MNARTKIFPAAALLAVFAAACGAGNPKDFPEAPMNIQLTSAAFAGGQTIPQKYTGDGSDVSPPLAWTGAPADAKSFALIADDPDAPAGTWVHWVIYDLPPGATTLAEGTPKRDALPDGAKQGVNDFRQIGYNGPAPPPGKPHRYFFKLYALDARLNLPSGLTKAELLKAMGGHVLAQGQLMGTFGR